MNHLLESLLIKVKIDPDPRVYFRICEEYRKEGDFENVIAFGQEGLTHEGGQYLPLLFVLARAYQENGEWKEAVRYYQDVVNMDPGHVKSNFGLGYCYLKLDDKEKAQPFIDNLKILQPEMVDELPIIPETVEVSELNEDVKQNDTPIMAPPPTNTFQDPSQFEVDKAEEDSKLPSGERERKILRLKTFLTQVRSKQRV